MNPNFTKDQIEFIKDLLGKQREWCNASHFVRMNILNAPEPELPEAVEESEPYGYANIRYAHNTIFTQEEYDSISGPYKKDHQAIYLHPEQPFIPGLIKALGWQGGTMHQVIVEVVRLKKESIVFPTDTQIIEYANEVKQVSEYDKGRWYGRVEGVNYLKSKIENNGTN